MIMKNSFVFLFLSISALNVLSINFADKKDAQLLETREKINNALVVRNEGTVFRSARRINNRNRITIQQVPGT